MASKLKDRKMTNVEFMTNLMEFSPHGAMGQVFILEALRIYCNQVLADTSDWSGKTLFSKQLWTSLAADYSERIENRYNNA